MPQTASWAGTPKVKGSSESMRMAFLTFSLIGLQFTWGIEMTYCTPYLLQLGLTKSRISAIWIAGPLSGLIMQPVVGVMADRSRSKWGRRRPIMVIGSFIVAACLLTLGWTAEVIGLFVSDPETRKSATVALAVLAIYAVDFSINAVQSCCRSLIVDTLPIPKQQLGSAWASRMVSIGHLVGYAAGTVDLVKIFGTTFGDSQFKQLTFISAAALVIAVGVTSYAVEERILLTARDSDAKSGALMVVTQILKTTLHMPARIRAICWVQFWSWIGWFPFLFYSTTWVGEVYFRYDAPEDAKMSKDALGDIGRIGSLSLVVFSFVAFAGSILLPMAIRSSEDDNNRSYTPRMFSRTPFSKLKPMFRRAQKYKPDLLTAWTMSFFVFAAAMILAPFARSTHFATALVSICGLTWALSSWAPYSMLGVEINKLSSSTSSRPHRRRSSSADSFELSPLAPSSPTGSTTTLHLNVHPDTDFAVSSSTGELSGVYLGILNLFTTLPQFVGTFISMIVFEIFEPGKSPELHEGDAAKVQQHGVNAISICLAIGALSMLVAAVASRRLRDTR